MLPSVPSNILELLALDRQKEAKVHSIEDYNREVEAKKKAEEEKKKALPKAPVVLLLFSSF